MLIGISGYIGSGKDLLGQMIEYQMLIKKYPEPGTLFLEKCLPGRSCPTWEEYKEAMAKCSPIYYSSNIRKFATKLKQIAAILTGTGAQMWEDREFKNSDMPIEWNRTINEAKDWLTLQNPRWFDPGNYANEYIVALANSKGFKWTRTYREFMQELGTEAIRNHLHPNAWVIAMFRDYHENPLFGGWPDWIITDMRMPNEAKAIKERGGLLIRIDGLPRVSDHYSEVGLDNYQHFDYRLENKFAAGKLPVEESLADLMNQAEYIVKYFNLVKYAGTNQRPEPDQSGS